MSPRAALSRPGASRGPRSADPLDWARFPAEPPSVGSGTLPVLWVPGLWVPGPGTAWGRLPWLCTLVGGRGDACQRS